MPYIVLLVILLLTGCQTSFYQGPTSDHFNGKRFYNIGEEKYRPHLISHFYNLAVAIFQKQWPNKLPVLQFPMVSTIPNDIKITFINHSTILLETPELNFLIDPIYAKRASPSQWVGPERHTEPGIAKEKLPRIDAVLISHNHYDHMDMSFLKYINKIDHPLFIIPLGNQYLMNKAGIYNVVALDWWQSKSVKNALVTFLPAHHSSQRYLNDYNRSLWGSYGISVVGKKLYFAGDTGYADHFKKIRQRWGKPDFSFIPIGAYEPRSLLEHDHLDPREAVKSHLELGSSASLGIHWGTFQLSSESMDQPLKDLEEARDEADLSEEEFFVMREGEPFYILNH